MVRPHNKAFTLIETITAMVVLSIIASSASLLVGRIGVTFRDRAVQDQLHLEASVALDRLVREIREIRGSESGSGIIPDITTANTTRLQWESSRLIDLEGTELRLDSDVLGRDVSALAFDFFDESGSSLLTGESVSPSARKDIQRVSISLSLTRDTCVETLHTLVFLRALTNPGAN